SNKVFYAGKNIFPFNAKIESLSDKFRHGITETPVELEEFSQLDEDFELIRTGDEHFVLLSVSKRKLCGWGFNSHHQLAMIDSYKVLRAPDVFFETEDDETIKFIECGKLSTCVVTEFNDLFIVGKFGSMTISTFTKIRQPIANTNISQLYLSDDDEIYLVTESGLVFKSNDFRNIMELQFDEFKFSNLDEKILKIAPGENFASIITESGRCFSLLKREKTLIESSKLKNLRVVDVNAGSQHVVVSAFRRIKDMNGNHETLLNQTYTINFKPIKGVGSGEENYQEPDTGENLRPALNSENISRFENEDKVSLLDLEESPRNIGSRATTLE
ncbi:CLUMA_CG009540, isoform A, partial [Clunio marinus]